MKSWFQDPFNTSLPTRKREKTNTSTTSGGTALGEEYGTWGMNEYKGMMDPTAYTGNVPGAQGPNDAQIQQYNMLTGMHTGYGAPDGYQNMYQNLSGANPQAIAAIDRSGGPKPGYTSPYQDEMIAGVDHDMKKAMEMASSMEGDLAQQYSSGGPSSVRSTNQNIGALGDVGLKYADMKRGIRDTGFRNAMGWQREDARDRAADITAMNRDNLGFGAMNMNAASNDMNNRMNMANLFGNYGMNRQNQQNMADQFGYGEFNRMQNWKPKMMNQYMQGLNATPWQTTRTTVDNSSQTGQGNKSNAEKTLGFGLTVKGFMMCIPEGTKIDTADGPVAIEDIKAGTKVKGYYKAETEVLQVHQYKEDPKPHRFYRIAFDNGQSVDCCDMHRIYNKRAQDYKVGDRIQNTKVTSITRYNGVERSYDLMTADGGYLIGGVPVNSMIEELASLTNELRKAA